MLLFKFNAVGTCLTMSFNEETTGLWFFSEKEGVACGLSGGVAVWEE